MEEIKFAKCIYIEDACLEKLSSMENLKESLYMMEVVSCGNVTDRGVIALHTLRCVHTGGELCFRNKSTVSAVIVTSLRNLEYLALSDLPGIKDKQTTVERLQKALPRLDIVLDLD